jgi:hypothetical protein
MNYKYNDGGRSNYFEATNVGDCVTRAIAIATNKDYKEVYDSLTQFNKKTPRNGVAKSDTKKFMESIGWKWIPLMKIGVGCKVHLRNDELPQQGTIIVKLSKHIACVKDGVLNDTYDCSRDDTRCVYGYWINQ